MEFPCMPHTLVQSSVSSNLLEVIPDHRARNKIWVPSDVDTKQANKINLKNEMK